MTLEQNEKKNDNNLMRLSIVNQLSCLVQLLFYLSFIFFFLFFFFAGYTCRITVKFGALKDDSLQIDSLTFNNCFSKKIKTGVNALINLVKHFYFVKQLTLEFVRILPVCVVLY